MQYRFGGTLNTEDEILTLKRLVKNLQDRIKILEKPSLWQRIKKWFG